jgi:ubiquinone/menaquinone biosynthesis C-methylase UbiE
MNTPIDEFRTDATGGAETQMRKAERYYDEFAASYEAQRHRGYHRLLDELEVELVERYCHGQVLEAGCGTGLILSRVAARFTDPPVGVDLSAGMLALARQRALRVSQASVDALPFPAASFDAVVSFKVLAHVAAIERTLAELARVTRPGGMLVLEFYNRLSLRYLIKQLKNPTRIGRSFTDEDVFTRYDWLGDVRSYLPPNVAIEAVHGIRVATPAAQFHDVPLLAPLLGRFERAARDLPGLRRLGGFLIIVARRSH